jgi:small GTP-binding protein
MNSSNYNLKTVIVGNTGVGKSCLIQKYTRDQFVPFHETTIGVDFAIKHLKIPLFSKLYNVKMQLWDTAGQEKFRAITQSYYRNCCAAVVVFDLTNIESFNSIDYWINSIREGCGIDTNIIIIGNKSDMQGQLVSESNLREKAIYFNVKYFLTSAKELDTTSIPFNIVAQDVLLKVTSNPNTTYPGARKIESQQKNNGFSINFEKPKKIKRNKCCIN